MSSGARSGGPSGAPEGRADPPGLSTNPHGRDRFVENPVDAAGSRPLPSGIRTGADARVTRSARGPGKPGREPDRPRKTVTTAHGASRLPTPGVAPRRRMAREPEEACPGPNARAAPDARSGHPRPAGRVRRRRRDRPRRARPDALRRRPRRHRRPRPAAPCLDRGDQPDRDPRARHGRRRARHRQPDRARGPARGRRRPVHRPRVGRRLPGRPARGRLPGSPGAPPRAGRQEGALPVCRHRRHGARRRRSRPRRSGPRRSPPTGAIADAGRPSRRAPSRHSPSSSSWPSRCSRREAA